MSQTIPSSALNTSQQHTQAPPASAAGSIPPSPNLTDTRSPPSVSPPLLSQRPQVPPISTRTSTPLQPTRKTEPPQPLESHQRSFPSRRQGKPIFDWISRKLGGRRASDAGITRGPLPPQSRVHYTQESEVSRSRPLRSNGGGSATRHLSPVEIFGPSTQRADSPSLFRSESLSLRSHNPSNYAPSERRREANNPYPSLPFPLTRRSYPPSTVDSETLSRPPSLSMLSRSRTPSAASMSSHHRHPRISLADDNDLYDGESLLTPREADDDASLRPIPPSHNSSPVPSTHSRSISLIPAQRMHQSSPTHIDKFSSSPGAKSFMSSDTDTAPRSRQDSMASTKPTTVVSFDSGNVPAARIAISPGVPLSAPSSPLGSPSSPPPRRTSASSPTGIAAPLPSPTSQSFLPPSMNIQEDTRVPRHTRYHPRNNPHPSSPPAADASTLTLASSTFGLISSPPVNAHPSSIRSRGDNAYHGGLSTSPSVAFADRPSSMYDGNPPSVHALSLSVRTSGTRGYHDNTRADDDASMRAIRRGSGGSEDSRWSWRPGAPGSALGEGQVPPPTQGPSNTGSVSSHRRSDLIQENENPTNRGSMYMRDSYRTALTAWGSEDEGESLDLAPSEPVATATIAA